MQVVTFRNWKCKVIFAQYENGNPAILLRDIEDNAPIATSSVNIVRDWMYDKKAKASDELPKNQCYLKTYSENAGMLEALEEAGVVKSLGTSIKLNPHGDTAPLVEILTLKE